jgi:HK97 family phage major capsid protein
LKLKKVAALVYATDEQLEDTTNLESFINRVVPEELRFQAENAIMNGDGLGKPLGIMNSPCLITVQRDTASRILTADVLAMWARRWAGVSDYVWYVGQDSFIQLPQLILGTTVALFMPPGGLTGAPYGTLLGRPVIETEFNPALNTTGDIMLASMSQYQTITKGGVQAASSIHVQFTTDETAFRFVYRIDGQPSWNSALTPFNGSGTQSPFVVLGSASA